MIKGSIVIHANAIQYSLIHYVKVVGPFPFLLL